MALTTTMEIAQRAYDTMHAALPEIYSQAWADLPPTVRTAFAYMVEAGSEAACEAIMEGYGFEDEMEDATCILH